MQAMIEHEPTAPVSTDDDGTFTVKQVSELFGLPERKLRYWSQTGFIVPSLKDGSRIFYNFRDLIAVKVAKALLDSGIPLRRVRRSLSALAEHLPDLDTSLSRLRIRCEGSQVVVDELAHSFEATTGQLVLDFSVESLREEAARVLTLPWVDGRGVREDDEPQTAYEWFLRGAELESSWGGSPVDIEGFEQAKAAYEQALELDPELAAAWTNLGSMFAEIGDLDGARERYERALACDPDQPEAHCNLAELALRAGDPEVAITSYRQVLRLVPDWAEAHYGLARSLLEVGGKGQALAHLERFCAAVDATPPEDRGPELEARRECAIAVIGELRSELAR